MDSRRIGILGNSMSILPSYCIDILGGGQLGRMIVEAASRLNISVTILDKPLDAPAKQISAIEHIQGDFTDATKIRELASRVDVLTVEIEHVNADVLQQLEKDQHLDIFPSPATIRIIQDKYRQKEHLRKNGVPVADYMDISDEEAARKAGHLFGYPFMLKSKTLAYDGRGNHVVKDEKSITEAMKALGDRPLYAEKWASFKRELAVMALRNVDGVVAAYPVVETVHKDNICHLVFVPAQVSGNVAKAAKQAALNAIRVLPGAGIFGVELFEMENGEILVNEIAPRPHNSGHYTIEACESSQFENHIRAILNLPFGSTALKVPAAAMLNILGTSSDLDEALYPCKASLSVDGATVHLYGKKECRKGRKMGHITVVGETMAQVHSRLETIVALPKSKTAKLASSISSTIDSISTASPSPATHVSPYTESPLVAIIMGSDSDLPTMRAAAQILDSFGVKFELTIVSAHRTPLRMVQFAKEAHERGVKVIIAGAGGAAHLPGMVAAMTPLPVIGVPVKGSSLDGVDSLYSIVQMPRGVPVATVAINNSTNAGLLAVRILGASIPSLQDKIIGYLKNMEQEVMTKVDRLETEGWASYQVRK